VSLWIELGARTILAFLSIVGAVFVTRVVTIPLAREAVVAARKRRLAKQPKARN